MATPLVWAAMKRSLMAAFWTVQGASTALAACFVYDIWTNPATHPRVPLPPLRRSSPSTRPCFFELLVGLTLVLPVFVGRRKKKSSEHLEEQDVVRTVAEMEKERGSLPNTTDVDVEECTGLSSAHVHGDQDMTAAETSSEEDASCCGILTPPEEEQSDPFGIYREVEDHSGV